MASNSVGTVCTGRGDSGDHCCYIDGQVCEYLGDRDGRPWCTVWDRMNEPWWRNTPVGRWFERRWPGKGYTCRDWPQNIPGLVESRNGVCCWTGADS